MSDSAAIRVGEFYETLEQIGEGTYGQVYKAKHIHTNEIVALKRIRMENEKEGFPITAIREIKILRELQHENVVRLKDIVTDRKGKDPTDKDKGSIYLVFEYMDHDLAGLMDSPVNRFFKPEQIKCYMKQMLQGLHVLHTNNILHRDIKASNLLINNKGILKLADFGLARPIIQNSDNSARYTNNVITLWYRPPELLLGAEQYGTHVDMWSVGCILAELLYKKPIFPGKTEVEQLDLIWRLCGTPTPDLWPGAESTRWWNEFKPKKTYKPRLREVFKDFPPAALDLVEKLLTLDPTKRISASDALDHDYFWTDPFPCDPSALPQYPSCHEWNVKKRKHMDPASLSAAASASNSTSRPSSDNGPPSKRYKPSSTSSSTSSAHPSTRHHHQYQHQQGSGNHYGSSHHSSSSSGSHNRYQGHHQPPSHHNHHPHPPASSSSHYGSHHGAPQSSAAHHHQQQQSHPRSQPHQHHYASQPSHAGHGSSGAPQPHPSQQQQRHQPPPAHHPQPQHHHNPHGQQQPPAYSHQHQAQPGYPSSGSHPNGATNGPQQHHSNRPPHGSQPATTYR